MKSRSRLPSRLLLLLVLAWRYLVNIGSPRSAPQHPRRILIAHHLLLGDTLMLTTLLAKLREQYPQAQIVMTVPKAIVLLYQKRPYGVTAVPYEPRDIRALIALIKISGFDLAIIPGDNRFSWLARALGARWIVAFAGDHPAYKSWPVDELISFPDKPTSWGDIMAGLISGNTPAPYQTKLWEEPDWEPFRLPQQPYVVLHVGASSVLKLWGNEKWAALATHLTGAGFQVVWSAGYGEEKIIAGIDPQSQHLSYAGKLTLAQLWHLLKHAYLLVSPDTGIAHLGRVVGTPMVTLFGPGSVTIFGAGDFWKNSVYRPVTINDFPCRDQRVLLKREVEWVRRCSRSTRECSAPLCMQKISVIRVQEAIANLLV